MTQAESFSQMGQSGRADVHVGASASFLAGGGEMGERIRNFAWASTPLGPPEQWPQSLKTVVRIMLTSRQPIWIGWGPELIKLYNDPYKAIVGGKHPAALGQPAAVVWHEIWDDIGPRLQTTMQNNEGTYDESLLLIMERYGYPEETYYTFSYSPVPGDQGGVEGIICANTDETGRIIGERQVKLLRTLAAETADARTIEEACRESATSLAHNPYDLPFTALYLLDHETQTVALASTSGIAKEHRALPEIAALDSPAIWPFAEVLREQKVCMISELDAVFDDLPAGVWKRPPHQAVVVPIAPSGQTGKAGVLIVGLNPLRLFDESYQGFIKLVAGQISASFANAQAYEEERKRAEALAELDRAKTLFFSNISHEFRTPLTLMLGPIEDLLAERSALSLKQREPVELLRRNALRLLRLVNTLLDFSRLEAGRMEAVYEPVDLGALTTDLASSFRSAIEKAGMTLLVECPSELPLVYVDSQMWEKVMLNLLSNAFKYTLQGTITVRIEPVASAVEVSVKDTGVGIPTGELPHMFERFHRVNGTEGRTFEGTGIGLSLVYELVKLHGGTIRVSSTPGQGSTFTVSLPLGASHLPAERIAAGRKLASTAANTSTYVEEALRLLAGQEAVSDLLADPPLPDGKEQLSSPHIPAETGEQQPKARILFADDNADMREYVSRLLHPRYTVQAVPDGNAALAAVKEFHPDLVLTDVMMPGMDGFALLHALRSDQETRNIPVILLSARAGEEAQIEGMASGADDYLVKPFSARELLARVEARLEIARLRKEAAACFRAERQRLHDLFLQAPAAIEVLRGPHHVFELANPPALQFLGVHRSVTGKPIREVLPELEGQGFFEILDSVYTTGMPFHGNEVLTQLDRKGDGALEDMYFNFVYQPSYNAAGEIDGVLVYANDVTGIVTARKRAEESEERFRALADNIPNLVWMARADGWIYWYNSRWYDYTGTTPEQMEGWGWQAVHDPQVLPTVLERWQRSIKRGEMFEMTFPLRGADGLFRPFLTRVAPIYDAEGQLVQWFGTNTDITGQKRLEQQKDEFIGIASHELKTPVTSLKGFTQLLERRFRKDGDAYSADLLHKMDAQINKLTGLVEDLLDITKIENGQLPMHFSLFDYNTLISEVIEETERAAPRHSIVQDLTPSVLLSGDRDRIGQVLTNLLTNAIKYSPQADTVLVKTVRTADVLITAVQDAGIGIPRENQSHLFERFFRVEGDNQLTYPGLGLGLYIAAEFVKRHQGSIWAESEQGTGTTMSFSLPLPREAAESNG